MPPDTFLDRSIIVNYPPTGGKDLPAGTHTFDFVERRVYLSDGTVEHMYTSSPLETCRSLLLYYDSEIDIKLYSHNILVYQTEISPPWVRNPNIEFDELKVTTTQPTMFHLQASNVIDGVFEMREAEYYTGNPYIYRGTVAVAGTYVELDVRASLGRKAHHGFIANMDATVGVLRVYENDGVSWTSDYYTIPHDGVENLSKTDISMLRIDSDVDNTAFEVNLR